MENQEKKPLYFYGEKQVTWKDKNLTRRVTISGVLDNDPTVLRIGQSMCSEKDKFVKSTARKIASGRALKHPVNLLKLQEGKTVTSQFIEFSKKLLAE